MNIIVTGTSRGLGRSVAESLARKGHDITGCSRVELETNLFKHIAGVDFNNTPTLDLMDPFLRNADCLINNVGLAYDGLLATQGESSIAQIIQANLVSTLLITKRYIRERLKCRSVGQIVNISSIIGIRGYVGLAAYSASKAGLDGMTRSLARELGPKGFRVNSILPGYMETDMSKSLRSDQKQQIINRTPLSRLATVDDVIPVIEFIISDSAKFITGQSIVIDGGITV
jgi:3-oxoacyl-[acyl-carrier protein] reductase